jgi:diguanylate cyclase (GGDEF)-like protein
MQEGMHERRRTTLLASVAAVAVLVSVGVAAAVVIGPLRAADAQLTGVVGGVAARAQVADASLRLVAVIPLLVVVTGALVAAPLRDWARRRAMEAPERVDPLTGSATRPAMLERLAHAVASTRRTEHAVAVLLLDVDGFRRLNEQHHHAVGDRVLMAVADRVRDAARRTDLVCRYGGDEFVVVAEHLDGESGAAVIADKLLAALRDPIHVDGGMFRVTASVGIAMAPRDTDDTGELLQLADSAMVEARRGGGDTYRFSTVDVRSDREQRRTTLAELRTAVDEGEFTLVYQPQIDLRSGQVVSAEALLRWQRDGDTAPVPAGRFIALADTTELSERLGRWTLDAAVAQVARWHATTEARLAVAVNLGARHVVHGSVVADVAAVLGHHGVDPRYLELEVPEAVLASHPERVVPVLRELRELGVRIVLDEFGTGGTSLAQLPELPLHAVKLDESLGDRLAGSGAPIVAGLVGLGRELGLQVVIPRIEHAGQLRRARQLGCHRAQGYLIAPPVEADRMASGDVTAPVA